VTPASAEAAGSGSSRPNVCKQEHTPSNVISYGYPDGRVGTVSIRFARQPEQILIRIDSRLLEVLLFLRLPAYQVICLKSNQAPLPTPGSYRPLSATC
jgi:hypothetical protein